MPVARVSWWRGFFFCGLCVGYAVIVLIVALQKTVTQGEFPAGAGAACATLVKNHGSSLNHLLLNDHLHAFSTYEPVVAQKGNCIYRPVRCWRKVLCLKVCLYGSYFS